MKLPILERIQGMTDEIASLQDICRVPSISIGVLHQNEVVATKSFGRRVCGEKDLDATPDTAYLIASCSKIFLACAVGILVDEGKLHWDDPISKYVPDFNPVGDSRVKAEATIRQALCHTTGLGRQMPLALGIHGQVLVDESNFGGLVNQAPTHSADTSRAGDDEPARLKDALEGTTKHEFLYSNFPLALVGLVVQNASGTRYSEFINGRIIQTLGLSQTITTREGFGTNQNTATGYAKLKDGTFAEVNTANITDESHTPLLSFLGVRSSVNDALKLSSAMLEAYLAEVGPTGSLPEDSENPLRGVSTIWAPHKQRSNQHSYGLGCHMGHFPSEQFSSMGINYKARHDDPEWFQAQMGLDFPQPNEQPFIECIGYFNCFSSSITLFPESRTAIVAFANGMDLGDAAGWASRLITQAVFDTPRADIVAVAKKEAELWKRWFDDMLLEWLEDRDIMHQEKSLDDYVGVYEGCNTLVEIFRCDETAHVSAGS